MTVREYSLCGAENTLAVQVVPSGTCISEQQFDRRLCYSDLATGGAFTIFGARRDLLSIVHNHMEFFANETCGFCVPCRAGNTLLLKSLEKIMVGNGTTGDLRSIEELGRMVKTGSRCGLGQTSPNPLLTTMENFRGLYLQKVRWMWITSRSSTLKRPPPSRWQSRRAPHPGSRGDMEQGSIAITLNGIVIRAKDGQSIVDAARENGTYIPTLCDYKSRPQPHRRSAQ
jgi:hypothetical protein